MQVQSNKVLKKIKVITEYTLLSFNALLTDSQREDLSPS